MNAPSPLAQLEDVIARSRAAQARYEAGRQSGAL